MKQFLQKPKNLEVFLPANTPGATAGPLSSAPANSGLEIQVKGWRALAKSDG